MLSVTDDDIDWKEYARLASKQKSVQTAVKLRKGFIAAPIEYEVLQRISLNEKDKKEVAKTLVKVVKISHALLLAKPDTKKGIFATSPWGFARDLYNERIGVLSYKGVEVAVFYKRLTCVVRPLPEDPVPEGKLSHPDDVWVRLDLYGWSTRQQYKSVREEMDGWETETSLLQVSVNALETTLDAKELEIKSLKTQLANATKKKGKR